MVWYCIYNILNLKVTKKHYFREKYFRTKLDDVLMQILQYNGWKNVKFKYFYEV